MTPGRKTTNDHFVPWSGNIEQNIDSARVRELVIHETADVSKTLTAQIQRMTDAGVQGFQYALPTANGLIVNCTNPQEAYDAVYGLSNVVRFPAAQQKLAASGLNMAFAGASVNDNGVSRAPNVVGSFDRATRGPMLGGFELDTPTLAA